MRNGVLAAVNVGIGFHFVAHLPLVWAVNMGLCECKLAVSVQIARALTAGCQSQKQIIRTLERQENRSRLKG